MHVLALEAYNLMNNDHFVLKEFVNFNNIKKLNLPEQLHFSVSLRFSEQSLSIFFLPDNTNRDLDLVQSLSLKMKTYCIKIIKFKVEIALLSFERTNQPNFFSGQFIIFFGIID